MKAALFGLAILASYGTEAETLYGTLSNDVVSINPLVPGGDPTNIAGGLNGGWGIAVDAAGNVYVGENYDVQKFTPGGTPLGVFANLESSSPMSMAFNSLGDLFVGVYDSILEFSPTGTYIGTINTGNSSDNTGLAFDASGNLYDADYGADLIRIYSPSGSYLGSWSGGLVGPSGLAFDSSGNLYVNNMYNVGVTKFNSSGTSLGSVISEIEVQYGYGIAIDGAGNFFVSVGNLPPLPGQVEGYGVKEFSSNGTYLQTFQDTDGGYIALSTPEPSTAVLSIPVLILLTAALKKKLSRKVS